MRIDPATSQISNKDRCHQSTARLALNSSSDDGAHLYSAGQDGEIRYWRLASDEYLRSVVRNGWSISVFAIDETKDIVAFGSSDGVMSVERLSDQTKLMRVGDERVPVLSIY